MSSEKQHDRRHGQMARVDSVVVSRPATASGANFVTLEDEYGMVNVVVWRTLPSVSV